MARSGKTTAVVSKEVYAVFGRMCIDSVFRGEFFGDPVPTANRYFGVTTDADNTQLKQLAIDGLDDAERRDKIVDLGKKMDDLVATYCPSWPC